MVYIFAIFGLLVAIFVLVANTVTFGDFQNAEESSLAVLFYVSDDLKEMPVYSSVGKILYSSDDELFEQGFHAKHYLSNEKRDNILKGYKQYFYKNHCLEENQENKDYYHFKFKCKKSTYSVSLIKKEEFLDVLVSKKIYR